MTRHEGLVQLCSPTLAAHLLSVGRTLAYPCRCQAAQSRPRDERSAAAPGSSAGRASSGVPRWQDPAAGVASAAASATGSASTSATGAPPWPPQYNLKSLVEGMPEEESWWERYSRQTLGGGGGVASGGSRLVAEVS